MYYDEEGAVESLSNSNDERSWEKKYCNCIAVDKQDMLKLCSGEMKEVLILLGIQFHWVGVQS